MKNSYQKLKNEKILDKKQGKNEKRVLFFADADPLFLSIMNTIRDPMIILDADLRVKMANLSFFRTFHVTPGETEGQQIFDLGNGQWDIPRLRVFLEEILPRRNSFNDFEVDHEFQTIGRKTMLLNGRQILGPPPVKEKLILLAIEDITEQKRGDRFRATLEAVPAGIVVVNNAGVIEIVNANIEKTFGYERGELIGKSIEVLVPLESRGKHPQFVAGFFANPRARPLGVGRELHGQHRDGRMVPVEIGLTPFKSKEGTSVIASVVDITLRKYTEQERDQALKSREELVAVVSHEIKTPLTTIGLNLDIIKRILPPNDGADQTQRLLDQIRTATDRMTHITSDLLDATKIEAGRLGVHPTAVDVQSLIEEVLSLLNPIAARKSVRLETKVSQDSKAVICDRGRIIQVLSNLLTNAIKFTEGDGTVQVEVDRLQNKIRFQVKDRGCGLSEEQIPHVFERFWQAKHREYLGAGLGLYIAKSILDAHGEKIGLESKVGEGSTFYFTLPASSEMATSLPKKAA